LPTLGGLGLLGQGGTIGNCFGGKLGIIWLGRGIDFLVRDGILVQGGDLCIEVLFGDFLVFITLVVFLSPFFRSFFSAVSCFVRGRVSESGFTPSQSPVGHEIVGYLR